MNNGKRILAVAVGPGTSLTIGAAGAPSDVRPYVTGLIAGLSAQRRNLADQDYTIDYREYPQFNKGALASGSYDLIFAMSTNVAREATKATKSVPIVAVISDRKAEKLGGVKNLTGISARRSQTAGECFEHFLIDVPTLETVYVLHKPKYGPSDRSLALVQKAAKKHGVKVKVVTVKNLDDLKKKLATLPARTVDQPATAGVHVLPVDLFFGAAGLIVNVAQGEKKLPTYWSITDFARPGSFGAFGGYGVSQKTCGELMAYHVNRILWGSKSPSALKVTEASDSDFDWAVSAAAAKSLGIKLLPRVV